MLAMWVKVRVKPEERERFLKAIEVDALGSERDEANCMRFNVLQDAEDQNVYYFYEVYRDEARRIGRRPITPSGGQPRTRWTARPRRHAARPSFQRRPGTGSENSVSQINSARRGAA
jgi:hypothetical protein